MHATAIFVFALPSTIPKSIFHFLFARLDVLLCFSNQSNGSAQAGIDSIRSIRETGRERLRALSIVQKMSVER